MRSRNALCLIFAALISSRVYADEGFRIRDTATLTWIEYSNDGYRHTLENTLLFYLSPSFQPVAHVARSETHYGTKTLFRPGFFLIGPGGLYAELSYGISVDQEEMFAQEGSAELTRETATTIASVRLRGGYDNATDVRYFIPDASFKKNFSRWYGVKLRYFFGWNSERLLSHSLVLEHTISFTENWALSANTTGIREETDGTTVYLWSAGGNLHGQITSWFGFTLNFQRHVLANEVTGIESGLTLDLKL